MANRKHINRKPVRQIVIILIWLIIWQSVSLLTGNSILCAGPVETIAASFRLLMTSAFRVAVCFSIIRIISGFIVGSLAGLVLAWFSYKNEIVADFLKPFTLAVRSVPVASFVILVLIWTNSSVMPFIVVSLVSFPIIYSNTLSGLRGTDKKLLEMAAVFRMPLINRIKYIYLNALKPYLIDSASLAAGMSWKSGIAAEVIGRPRLSMGEGIYNSKIYLQTAELFAWTLCAVVLAAVGEKILKIIMRRILK